MRSNIQLVLLFSAIALSAHAQNDDQLSLLNVGDPAPALRFREWIKGSPVQKFEKGHIYVLDFWATWCGPCIRAMPKLSTLAASYKDTVTFIAIDVFENWHPHKQTVKRFVDSMGNRMDYRVATEDSNFIETGYFDASGEEGIPKSFIVNAEGKLAWIGDPRLMEEVLEKVVNNTWNVKKELDRRNFNRYLAKLDQEANDTLKRFVGNANKYDYIGKPDSALMVISDFVKREPKLEHAPLIASHTFSSLLKTNPHRAYEYSKVVLVTPTYDDPPYQAIIDLIKWYSDKLNIPAEIYEVGAEAYQLKINRYGQFGNIDVPNNYNHMAEMYWRAKDKVKAIEAMGKAIRALKNEKKFPATKMAAFESQLQQYKHM